MANFFNPYMKKPDWGQGTNDMMNQLMMMYLLGMFPTRSRGTGKTPFPKEGTITPEMQQQMQQNPPQPTTPWQPGSQAPMEQGWGQSANAQNPYMQLIQQYLSGYMG